MIELLMTATAPAGELGTGGWVVALLLTVLFFAVRAQLNPFTRCTRCGGRPPGDTAGTNYHRCPRCQGASERLRFGAWAQRRIGIPVPRAKPPADKNRWAP